jgi:GAF domain-containing protein
MLYDTKYHPDAVIGAFGRVAAAVANGGRRDAVLSLIATSVLELVGADSAGVTLRAADGQLVTVVAEGADAESYQGVRYPPEGTSTDRVLRTGEAVVVDNLSTVPVIGVRLPGVALGPTAFVPVMVDGPYAVLSVSRLVGRPVFTDTDLEVIRAFAAQSALVIQNDCQRRRSMALDVIAAQARLADELHDTAIQEIFAASLMMSGLANQIDKEQRELVVTAIGALDNAIKLIREAIFGLREDGATARGFM